MLKEYHNLIEKKSDHFKSDDWKAFENEEKTRIYFQKYDNYIGQMRTFEIDKTEGKL